MPDSGPGDLAGQGGRIAASNAPEFSCFFILAIRPHVLQARLHSKVTLLGASSTVGRRDKLTVHGLGWRLTQSVLTQEHIMLVFVFERRSACRSFCFKSTLLELPIMPLAVIDAEGTRYVFTDSGPIRGCVYQTLMIFHDTLFNGSKYSPPCVTVLLSTLP